MKAGLLMCDHVADRLQAEYGDYSDMFAHLFPMFSWEIFDVRNGHFPENIDSCDLYIATGSRYSVYDNEDWIKRLLDFVRELDQRKKYFFGFCFGHQLIGHALGGKVEKSPKGWCVGVHSFQIKEKKAWMVPFRPSYNLLMLCQDQIAVLPDRAQVLAGNEMCPYGFIQIDNHIIGIQGHLEFSKAYDRLMMESRVDRIGKEVVEKAVRSLDKRLRRRC